MVAATQHRDGTPVLFRRAGWLLAACAALLAPAAGLGQEAALPEDGVFITVPAPLDSRAFNGVKAATNRALAQKDRKVTILVYDFNPGDRSATSDDYGACRNLAEFLLNLQDVTSVAFVHKDVTGHLVLPVLACREIVMAEKAKLGNPPQDSRRPLLKDQLAFYEQVVTD